MTRRLSGRIEAPEFNGVVTEFSFDYPHGTPGRESKDGNYFKRLSSENQVVFDNLRAHVAIISLNVKELSNSDYLLHEDLVMLRYLRANQFVLAKTIEHMEKNIFWRQEVQVDTLTVQDPEKILGCGMEELTKIYPHWHSGYDKTGRPVLFKQYGKFDAAKIKTLLGGTFDNLVKYHIWEQEQCNILCVNQSRKLNRIIETITGVIDVKGMTLGQVTQNFLNLTKSLAAIDQNQYPETLGRIFIINTPSAFPFVWRMVKVWLDPAVAAKISVCGGPGEYEPLLFDFIGRDNLPSNYGGSLPPLSSSVHPYAETMKELLSTLDVTRSMYTTADSEESKDGLEGFNVLFTMDYPLNTPGHNSKDGSYFKRLSGEYQAIFDALKQHVTVNNLSVKSLNHPAHFLHDDLTLLRYLRANQFVLAKTIEHMEKNIAWRQEVQVDALTVQDPEKILGCGMEELTNIYPHWHSGYDKTGRPVLFKQYGKFDAAKIKTLLGGTFDNLVKYHIWEQEQCNILCVNQSRKLNRIVETITGVIDVKGMTLGQVTQNFLNLTKSLAAIDQNQYPETLGRIFIINTPSAFPFVWRMVKVWLDPAVAAKISVCGGPGEYEPLLFDFIGRDNLPSNYGGSLPPLSSSVHPYAETMRNMRAAEGITSSTINSPSPRKIDSDTEPPKTGRESLLTNRPDSFNKQRSKASQRNSFSSVRSSTDDNGGGGALTGLSYFANMFLKRFQLVMSDSDEEDESAADGDIEAPPVNQNTTANAGSAGTGSVGDPRLERILARRRSKNFMVEESKSVDDEDDDALFSDAFATQLEMDQSRNRLPPGALDPIKRSVHFAMDDSFHENQDPLDADVSSKSFLSRVHTWYFFKMLRHAMRAITPTLEYVSLNTLCLYVNIAITVYVLLAVTSLSLSAFVLSNTSWSAHVAKVQMWAGIVVLLISSLMIIFNFVGYLAIYTKSRPLLVMFASGLGIGTIVFGIVFIACFLYYYVPQVAGIGNQAFRAALHEVRQFDLILGIICLIAAVFGLVPLILTLTVLRRLKREFGSVMKPDQLQTVLKVAQLISICFAVVMIGYGGSCVYSLLQMKFIGFVFDVYGLIYGGVSVIIAAIIGVWSSRTAHKSVLLFYYKCILPILILVLFVVSLISFINVADSDTVIHKHYDEMQTKLSESAVKVTLQTYLLVTGILAFFACMFQAISFFAARTLWKLISFEHKGGEAANILKTLREKGLGIHVPQTGESDPLLSQVPIGHLGRMYMIHVRGSRDKLVIGYAIFMGIYNLYVNGTFVVFSAALRRHTELNNYWMYGMWTAFGSVDERFVASDAYLVSCMAILAVIVGPLLLFFAWATFVLAPFRHAVGIIVSTIQIFTWIQFYTIEVHKDFSDFHGSANPGGVAVFVLLSFLVYVVLPVAVLWRELTMTVKDTSKSDSHELLLESNKADNNFLQENSDHSTATSRRRKRSNGSVSSTISSYSNSHEMFRRFSIDTQEEGIEMYDRAVQMQQGSIPRGPSPKSDASVSSRNRDVDIAAALNLKPGSPLMREERKTSSSPSASTSYAYGTYATPSVFDGSAYWFSPNNKKMIKEYSQEDEDNVREILRVNPDVEGEPLVPLTSFSIAAAAASAKQHRKSPIEEFKMNHEGDEGDDLVHQNTNQNKYSNNNNNGNKLDLGRVASRSAFGAMVKRQSYPYRSGINSLNNLSNQSSSGGGAGGGEPSTVTNQNMNTLMQQIGVNTVEAATVMMNLVQMKEKKKSLAMVI